MTAYGYDGNGYSVGDRIEMHPATDLWMRGACYGVVTRGKGAWVSVRLDALPERTYVVPVELLRRIPEVA